MGEFNLRMGASKFRPSVKVAGLTSDLCNIYIQELYNDTRLSQEYNLEYVQSVNLRLESCAKGMGYSLQRLRIAPGLDVVASAEVHPFPRVICLDQNLPDDLVPHSLIHEITHIVLHIKGSLVVGVSKEIEIEAETVTYILARYYRVAFHHLNSYYYSYIEPYENQYAGYVAYYAGSLTRAHQMLSKDIVSRALLVYDAVKPYLGI